MTTIETSTTRLQQPPLSMRLEMGVTGPPPGNLVRQPVSEGRVVVSSSNYHGRHPCLLVEPTEMQGTRSDVSG